MPAELSKFLGDEVIDEPMADKQYVPMLLGQLHQPCRRLLRARPCIREGFAVSRKAEHPQNPQNNNPDSDGQGQGATSKVRYGHLAEQRVLEMHIRETQRPCRFNRAYKMTAYNQVVSTCRCNRLSWGAVGDP